MKYSRCTRKNCKKAKNWHVSKSIFLGFSLTVRAERMVVLKSQTAKDFSNVFKEVEDFTNHCQYTTEPVFEITDNLN